MGEITLEFSAKEIWKKFKLLPYQYEAKILASVNKLNDELLIKHEKENEKETD